MLMLCLVGINEMLALFGLTMKDKKEENEMEW